MNFINWEKK